MIFPGRNLVLAALLPAVLALALFVDPRLLTLVLATDGLVLLAALADLLTLPRRCDFGCARQCAAVGSLGQRHRIKVTLSNLRRSAVAITVRDDVPPELEVDRAEFDLDVPGRARVTVAYAARPRRRGAFRLEWVAVQAASRLALWRRDLRLPAVSQLRVYPDLKQISQYTLLARLNRVSLLGVRRTRRVGADNEFERLRDYTADDNYRHIDWRATARRRKLTVRDYQASQSQRVIFLIDSGRMMVNEAQGLSLLDHAVNAMLLLAHVALDHGDQAGLLTFSDRIHGYAPPRAGRRRIHHLAHQCYDLFPELVESRYDRAFLYLHRHCRKRSLVILITNLIDEVNANQVQEHLAHLAGNHLPLGVLLRDQELFRFVQCRPEEGPELYRAAVASNLLGWRQQVLKGMQQSGVLTLDVFPEELTARLITEYLEIKARHLL